jgi:hypothetical protein
VEARPFFLLENRIKLRRILGGAGARLAQDAKTEKAAGLYRAAMLIAQAVPTPVLTSNDQAVFFFLLCGSLAFLLWCSVSVVSIIASLRRKPSIEAEFATKTDLNNLKAEFNREIGKIEGTTNMIFQKIDHLTSSLTKSLGDIQRDIGRLEGHSK